MRAARMQLDVAAHNLANVSSDGFRRARAMLRLTPRGLAAQVGTVAAQGPLRPTGAPWDLAIAGPGSFDVGGVATRRGAFSPDRDGYLAGADGRRLRGTRGPVRVDAATTIASDGTVRRDGTVVNRIPLPAGSTVRSGFLEGANADAIGEMLEVLTAQRAFETAQKAMLAIDEARDRAANDVGRLK